MALRKRMGDDTTALAHRQKTTDHYWISMYCFLSNQVYRVHVINPMQFDAVRNLYISKSKIDRKYSLIISNLLWMNQTK